MVSSPAHTGGYTVGGTVVAQIMPDEFYTLIPNDSAYITSFEVIVQNPSKVVIHGYIETSPGTTLGNYAWAASQEPYHYYNSNGTSLVSSTVQNISGVNYRIFTVYGSTRTVRDSSGVVKTTVGVGTKLAALDSTTGVTYGDHMLFYLKQVGGVGACQTLVSGGSSTYGFVDMGMAIGVFPTTRQIR
jgi:hypothetical protein